MRAAKAKGRAVTGRVVGDPPWPVAGEDSPPSISSSPSRQRSTDSNEPGCHTSSRALSCLARVRVLFPKLPRVRVSAKSATP
jgi:hypothetical protein